MKLLCLLVMLWSVSVAGQQRGICDESLWKHVYDQDRLLRLPDGCITIIGKVKDVKRAADGDRHVDIYLDAPIPGIINAANHRALVVEIMCIGPIWQPNAFRACSGFKQHLPIPKPGQWIEVTGVHVIDTIHLWEELHPISKLIIFYSWR